MKGAPEVLLVVLAVICDYTSAELNKTASNHKKPKEVRSSAHVALPNVTYPFLAAVEFNTDNEHRMLVTGTLLNKYWVLTQASISHSSLKNRSVDYIMVRLGVKDSHNFISEHTTSEYYINPRYQPASPNSSHRHAINDLLLVKLQRPAIFVDSKIKPITLPSRSDFNVDLRGFTLRMVGFPSSEKGSEKPANPSESLKVNGTTIQKIELRVLSNQDSLCCTDPKHPTSIHHDLNDGQFCGTSTSSDVDPVLRGAPVLWGPEDEPVLTGVYSYSYAYSSKRSMIFSRIAMYLEWIEQTTGITIADQ